MTRGHILTCIAIVLLYAAFLGRHGVLQQTEARYAEVAREMKASRDFMTPRLNGVPHVQKPPVTYWITSASMMLFGVNEIGARAVPLAAGLGVLLLTAWIGTLWFNRRTGLLAALLLAGSFEFYMLSRTLCADMIMTFFSTAAIAAFASASRRGPAAKPLTFLPFFVFMGMAFATKGPMGIVVPLCAVAANRIHARQCDVYRPRMPWLLGMGITLVLAASWFIAISLQTPELWRYFLKYELVDRFFSDVHGRSEPFWYFLPVLLGGWLPWSLLVTATVFGTRNEQRDTRSESAEWGLLGWITVPFVILSLSGSKLATYILPLLPGVALWFAVRLSRLQPSRSLLVAVFLQALLFAVLGIGVGSVMVLKKLIPPGGQVDNWFLPVWTAATVMAIIAFWQLRKGICPRRLVAASLASLFVLATLSSQVAAFAPVMGTGVSLRTLADRIKEESHWEDAQVIVAGIQGHGIEFYLQRFVDNTLKHADVALPLSPALAQRIHPSVNEIRYATNGLPCFVITKERNLRKGKFPEPEWSVLDREGSFILLKRNETL